MQDLLKQPETWHSRESHGVNGSVGPTPSGSPQSWLAIGAGAAVAILTLVLVLAASQPRSQGYTSEIAQLRELIQQGKTDLVAGLADLYLSRRDASEEAQVALASLRHLAAMEEIYKHPEMGGESAVVRWQEAEAKADEFRVPRDARPPMTCFTGAVNARVWALARACFLRAWADGKVGPPDRQAILGYYATLYNGGSELILRTSDEARGWRLVATACAIDEAYGVYQGVACQTLRERFETNPPPPFLDDPVLNLTRTHGR